MAITRRGFLGAGVAGAVTIGCSSDDEQTSDPGEKLPELPEYEYDGPLGPSDLFEHGVASGDPLPDGIILWTRASVAETSVEIWWEISENPEFTRRVQVGTKSTDGNSDYTLKVDVRELKSGKTYYYRFFALGVESPIGRTKTAPSGDVARLRFGVTSCSSLAHGHFHVYRYLRQHEDLDAILHLGDYIYEYATGEYGNVREYEPAHEIVSLEDYRMRHSQYKRDADLQELHRQFPFVVTWDDHEVANDSYKDGAENHTEGEEGSWADRKAAGIKAYAEWMPIRGGEDGKIWRSLSYGNLADLIFLDTRLWGRDEKAGGLIGEAPMEEPGRTLLGADQEAWIKEQLEGSTARWKIVGQQVMMAQLKSEGAPNSEGGGQLINNDQWHAYPGSRDRFLAAIEDGGVNDVVVLTGDIHTSWGNDLTTDPNNTDHYDPATGKGSSAVEFVTSAVTSPGFPTALLGLVDAAKPENPHIKYVNAEKRGYLILDLDSSRAQAAWYLLDGVEDPSQAVESLDMVMETQSGANTLKEGAAAAESKDTSPAAP